MLRITDHKNIIRKENIMINNQKNMDANLDKIFKLSNNIIKILQTNFNPYTSVIITNEKVRIAEDIYSSPKEKL